VLAKALITVLRCFHSLNRAHQTALEPGRTNRRTR
jgi:hypothetical protein